MLLLMLHSIELLQTSTALHAQINAGHQSDDEEDDENYCRNHPACVIAATSSDWGVRSPIVHRWQVIIGRQGTGGDREKESNAYCDDPLEIHLQSFSSHFSSAAKIFQRND